MIRRDYILRVVQELGQMLRRAVSLRERHEYEAALRELGHALEQLEKAPAHDPTPLPFEHWLALCEKETVTRGPLLIAVAELLREQGELLWLQAKEPEARRSWVIALGLYLEAILGGHTFVSVELLDRIEELIAQLSGSALPAPVLQRLFGYFEERGQFAKAENALFDWLDTNDPRAAEEGLAFYERLAARPEAELARGELPKAEVEQGRRELQRRLGR